MSMERFYTRPQANEGRKLPLYAPDGSATDEWLLVRHVLSDAFQEANEAAKRRIADLALSMGDAPDGDKLAKAAKDARVDVLASLVADWSFGECTPDKVREFLTNAPQIADQIDSFAADSKGFFGREPRSVKRGSKAKSA